MLTIEDFTRHRPHTVGAVAHRVIGQLAAVTRTPTPCTIIDAVATALPPLRPDESLAHRQTIASAVNSYFLHLLPPVAFQFAGAEVQLGTGRVDLVWRCGDDVLLDEVKTGSGKFTRRDLNQAHGYAEVAWETLNGRFLGVRLVSTFHPTTSLLIPHDGPSQALHASGLLAPRSR